MGVGKTFQVLTLVHSVRQRLKKIVIVAPSGIIPNWEIENIKWLNEDRLRLQVCAGSQGKQEEAVRSFLEKEHAVMLTTYRLFTKNFYRLNPYIDLIIFDEGHRLRSKHAVLVQRLSELECKRRILMTGTPIQNNLEEFYNCALFVCPTLMMDRRAFMNKYDRHIMQCLELSDEARELHRGTAQLNKLKRLGTKFMLRRTEESLKTLPPKYEYLLFCPLSSLQYNLYRELVRAYVVKRQFAQLEGGSSMTMMCMLQKLTNHPDILYNKLLKASSLELDMAGFFEIYEESRTVREFKVKKSTKFMFLSRLIKAAIKAGDNTIVCSSFTSTLDAVESYLISKDIRFLRIDGNTQPAERQDNIDKFKSSLGDIPVFLLSSKAGGVGINLIGGNRMVLMEPDWNPSNDTQLMGRVWREGQLRPVYIYRLFASGTLEEKIYQMQLTKTDLSKQFLDVRSFLNRLSEDELYDMFKLYNCCQSYQPSQIHFADPVYTDSFLDEMADLVDALVPNCSTVQPDLEGLPQKRQKI
jgi:SNF2 family DNA or RNA helicase